VIVFIRQMFHRHSSGIDQEACDFEKFNHRHKTSISAHAITPDRERGEHGRPIWRRMISRGKRAPPREAQESLLRFRGFIEQKLELLVDGQN
jgi:hypothetical protein